MNYEQFRIKTYSHWGLFLHSEQYPYIGRCYAWAKRERAKKVTDMFSAERDELFHSIVPQWSEAITCIFGEHWPNFAILGNTSPHLHAHLVPRHSSPRVFQGIEFVDPNPGKNYAPYPKKEIPLEVLLQIKEEIQRQVK